MEPHRRAAAAALVLSTVLLGSWPVEGHAMEEGDLERSILVTRVQYTFPMGSLFMLGQPTRAVYTATVVEEGHGTRSATYGLGPARFPSAAWARDDLTWGHVECSPGLPVRVHFGLALYTTGPVTRYYATQSPDIVRTAPGSYRDTWEMREWYTGAVIGTASVDYEIRAEPVVRVQSIDFPDPCA